MISFFTERWMDGEEEDEEQIEGNQSKQEAIHPETEENIRLIWSTLSDYICCSYFCWFLAEIDTKRKRGRDDEDCSSESQSTKCCPEFWTDLSCFWHRKEEHDDHHHVEEIFAGSDLMVHHRDHQISSCHRHPLCLFLPDDSWHENHKKY